MGHLLKEPKIYEEKRKNNCHMQFPFSFSYDKPWSFEILFNETVILSGMMM